ncbi:fumarylacetoacetate hydrolase family protein [Methylocystis heyeri]|uniref:2-keto-4-pentenoate hydratase n=1 Tax=Methylocystis heyeri TaxID=391905 RepID=A0A6B8KKN6_9HYPH|nr:fumarylacetoacetate hydrolase family protein [Methylocystis heyeri]QGM47238.1 2-keto-4-pentenoate hydratase [Methylocystis heyeri]
MKLASLKEGRDGRLVVVSKDLSRAVDAAEIAATMQAALDRWEDAAPRLERLAEALENGAVESFAFRPEDCAAPLPRAYQWLDGSAYVNHVELVRKARGATMPESFWSDPLMYQGGSDSFLGPCDPILLADESWGLDLEAEVAVVTDDVAQGVDPRDAGDRIRLAMLVNDVTLRALVQNELAKGFGFMQSKPSSSFSPVAVTLGELGERWKETKLHLPLLSYVNGELLGRPDAGVDMAFDFARLIAHAARTRSLSAGTIIGSGTVSNRAPDCSPGRPVSEGGIGYSCLAERNAVEKLLHGAVRSGFLKFGDRIRVEMRDDDGRSIFGAIEQTVAPAPETCHENQPACVQRARK